MRSSLRPCLDRRAGQVIKVAITACETASGSLDPWIVRLDACSDVRHIARAALGARIAIAVGNGVIKIPSSLLD